MQDSTGSSVNTPAVELSAMRGESLVRIAGLVEDLPYAVLCLDASWRITWANMEAIRLSRLDPGRFAAETFWELHPFLLGTEAEGWYRRAMETREPEHLEYFSDLLGAWVDLHTVATDEGMALVYRDVTARKQSEQRDAAVN